MSFKTTLSTLLVSAVMLASCGKTITTNGRVDVIPIPNELSMSEGNFVLKPSTPIAQTFEAEGMEYALNFWNSVTDDVLGCQLNVSSATEPKKGAINIVQDSSL